MAHAGLLQDRTCWSFARPDIVLAKRMADAVLAYELALGPNEHVVMQVHALPLLHGDVVQLHPVGVRRNCDTMGEPREEDEHNFLQAADLLSRRQLTRQFRTTFVGRIHRHTLASPSRETNHIRWDGLFHSHGGRGFE